MQTTVNNYTLKDNSKGKITALWLKIIAVVTMFIDHLAASVLLKCLLYHGKSGFINYDNEMMWWNTYEIMRYIGRMAFPLYCFMLVEGLRYTRNRKKYAIRLLIFAFISEIPFDMAFNECVLEFKSNNVFFTLFIGLIVIWIMDTIKNKLWQDNSGQAGAFKIIIKYLLMLAVVFTGMAVAEYVLRTDYGAGGVACIVVMYLLQKDMMLSFGAGVIILGMMCGSIEYLALLMLIPLHFYNGQRGRQVKYFFYLFYPVHLLLFALVDFLLGFNFM